jgi:hypothetical protein
MPNPKTQIEISSPSASQGFVLKTYKPSLLYTFATIEKYKKLQ